MPEEQQYRRYHHRRPQHEHSVARQARPYRGRRQRADESGGDADDQASGNMLLIETRVVADERDVRPVTPGAQQEEGTTEQRKQRPRPQQRSKVDAVGHVAAATRYSSDDEKASGRQCDESRENRVDSVQVQQRRSGEEADRLKGDLRSDDDTEVTVGFIAIREDRQSERIQRSRKKARDELQSHERQTVHAGRLRARCRQPSQGGRFGLPVASPNAAPSISRESSRSRCPP